MGNKIADQIKKKIRTLFWFLKNPKYIPHVFQILKREKITEDTKEEAIAWCIKNEVDKIEVYQRLTGNRNFENLDVLFPKVMKKAQHQADICPVKMGGEGAISFLYHVTKAIRAERIIETGVAYGWSSLAILLAINNSTKGKLISNDMPYIKMNNDNYVGCIIPNYLKTNWELQRLPDVKGIPLAIRKFNNEIDLCHYDSDKSYAGRMFAYPKLWNALRAGGLFVSDDIQDNTAFLHFTEMLQLKPFVFEHRGKYVGVIKKQGNV